MACPTGDIVVNPPDPRISYNVTGDEGLQECPYNRAHLIRRIKYAGHVLNCHRMHVASQKAKGEEPLFKICQYDRSHHVRKESIEDHEANCPSKKAYFGDGWSDEEDEAKNEAAEVKLEKPSLPVGKSEIGDKAWAAIAGEESWDDDGKGACFDSKMQIDYCRASGYKLIDTQEAIGKSKSEKRAFYKQDAHNMEVCERVGFLDRLRGSQKSASGVAAETPPSTTLYGYETGKNRLDLASIDEMK